MQQSGAGLGELAARPLVALCRQRGELSCGAANVSGRGRARHTSRADQARGRQETLQPQGPGSPRLGRPRRVRLPPAMWGPTDFLAVPTASPRIPYGNGPSSLPST